MTLRMLKSDVLLGPVTWNRRSPGGIHLLGTHRPWVDTDDSKQYRVLAVGPGRWVKRRRSSLAVDYSQVRRLSYKFLAPEVEPGDLVLVNLSSGAAIKETLEDGSKRLIVDSSAILLKWRPKGA